MAISYRYLKENSLAPFLYAVVAGLCVLAGVVAIYHGYGRIQAVYQMERVPLSLVRGVIPGEVKLSGEAEMASMARRYVVAKDTSTRCIWYRLLVEQEDDDDWSTVSDTTEFVERFRLRDDSGALTVRLHDGFKPAIEKDHYETRGNRRYSEWRIDEGEELTLFGLAVMGQDGREEVCFDQPGAYEPVLSNSGDNALRGDRAKLGVFWVWVGIICTSLAVMFVCYFMCVHRVYAYMLILMPTISLPLFLQGVVMMGMDLKEGMDRIERHREAASGAVQRVIAVRGVAWTGEWDDRAVFDSHYIIPTDLRRVRAIREDLARAIDSTNEIRGRFPQIVMAWILGVPREKQIDLPEDVRMAIGKHEGTKVGVNFITMAIAGLLFLLSLVFTWLGVRRIRVKRWIDNVPTCQPSGVVVGLTETKGKVVSLGPPINARYTGALCVCCKFKKEEKRGSGKNEKWVTIEEGNNYVPFYCDTEDEKAARIVIDPDDAEIYTHTRDVRRYGSYRETEYRLDLKDSLYVLGTAEVSANAMEARGRTHEGLIIRKGKGDPFVLSNRPEREVLLAMARNGFAWLNMGMVATTGSAMALFSMFGGFSMLDFLFSALIPPFYMFWISVIMIFNDLVFLRLQVSKARANIDVALERRADLIPNLEKILKEYMSHESALLEWVAQFRAAAMQHKDSPVDAFLSPMVVLFENYPDLKANEAAGLFIEKLKESEDYVAYMRDGLNHAVELYNTRISTVPDLFLARLTGFGAEKFFMAEDAERERVVVQLSS